MRPGGKGARGFTLVEVILSTGVLVVGVVALAAGVTSLSQLRRTTTETQRAVTAARTRLEQLRGEDFSTLVTNYGVPVGFAVDLDGDGYPDLDPVAGAAEAGSIEVQVVTDVPASAVGQLLRGVATVRWRGVGGDREVRLVTMISDPGT